MTEVPLTGQRRLLQSALEFSDACVAATRAHDAARVRTLLDELEHRGGHRRDLVLSHWAYLLVDFCRDQVPGPALASQRRDGARRDSTPEEDARSMERFWRGEGEQAKAQALNLVLYAGTTGDHDLTQAALTTISTWPYDDRTEFAAILLNLVAANLPRHSLPSEFVYLSAVLFEAAEPDGAAELVVPLARLVSLHWTRYRLDTKALVIESIRLIGLDYPTPDRRAAAIRLLCRALARGRTPGRPVTSFRRGRALSDASPLPAGNAVDAVDIIACRVIGCAAAGRAEDIPAVLVGLTGANDAQALHVLLLLARRLAHDVRKGADRWGCPA